MQCLVLAGGRATRLGGHGSDRPKFIVDVAGSPFADLQLDYLARSGVTDVVCCIGFRGEQIRSYVGDGATFGLRVTYVDEGNEFRGTGGAIRLAYDHGLLDERFLTIYGDTLPKMELRTAFEQAESVHATALMTVMRNQGRFDTSNAHFDGQLVTYDKAHPTDDMDWIDYGVSVLTRSFASTIPPGVVDLADVFHELSARGKLVGLAVEERFHEIGTPQSRDELAAIISDLKGS